MRSARATVVTATLVTAALVALITFAAGCGPIPFSDPGLGQGMTVTNRTDRALRFSIEVVGDRIPLPGAVDPGETALIISGSALGPDSLVAEDGCTTGTLIATDDTGREVARHPESLCIGDDWVVGER